MKAADFHAKHKECVNTLMQNRAVFYLEAQRIMSLSDAHLLDEMIANPIGVKTLIDGINASLQSVLIEWEALRDAKSRLEKNLGVKAIYRN